MKKYIYVVTTICTLIGCKEKEDLTVKDTVPPAISFTSPVQDQHAKVSDTIWVKGKITDDVALKAIVVSAFSDNGVSLFNYSLDEEDFSSEARISHHGPHNINLIDIKEVSMDTFFVTPPTPADIKFVGSAWDQEGNSQKIQIDFHTH